MNIKPHIQLNDFTYGCFPNERIGYFKDYEGNKQYLELQTHNSNFTKYGLLEISIIQIYDNSNKVLIHAMNDCYLKPYIINQKDILNINQDSLRYDKKDYPGMD